MAGCELMSTGGCSTKSAGREAAAGPWPMHRPSQHTEQEAGMERIEGQKQQGLGPEENAKGSLAQLTGVWRWSRLGRPGLFPV